MDEGRVVMPCSTHGMVVPDAEAVHRGDAPPGGVRVVEWHCPLCGEHLGEFIDGGIVSPYPTDRMTNTEFQMFEETFEGLVSQGDETLEGLLRFWRQKLFIGPRWKPCVQIECPPLTEYKIDFTQKVDE